ncbi:MAG: DUF3536 domain-containing protein [Candidatus Riflebacteria bacterium]|nr:DUF3536 domain-containing protein [Candidatus Riflebacteria bacterium]
MEKFICIHGHFYQPPRENPWLEEVELQDSAFPFHDWNQRITTECYAPIACSRRLNAENKISGIVNNYSRISFNLGPSLLTWIQRRELEVYQAILQADRDSIARFNGHGSAIAQVYNHLIMPLANPRDKETQVIWGIRDFEARFQRKPEGMWLSEAAVDLETLEVLARNGIRFTILAPRQASRVRPIGSAEWTDVRDARVDPKIPYWCVLPSGSKIAVFFYDGLVAQDIAFGGLLSDGRRLADRLTQALVQQEGPQLVHVATDGESYGHHHRFGDMALTACLDTIESQKMAQLTNYGEYLERFPPNQEVEIIENSSWSCVHGIERWRKNCGCNSGKPGWHQHWRAPLRGAFDWLRDHISPIFEQQLSSHLRDPWEARNDYIAVILARSDSSLEEFFSRHQSHPLTSDEKTIILEILEMTRNAMLMYTSCGWFFDEISGIETVQTLRYSARVIQLAQKITKNDFEDTFIQLLERAESNITDIQNGKMIYLNSVKPSVLDLLRVGIHFGVSSLFKEYEKSGTLHAYRFVSRLYEKKEYGRQKAAFGWVDISSNITRATESITFAVVHLGDHNIVGGARQFIDENALTEMGSKIMSAFQKGNTSEIIHLIDEHFQSHNCSLWHLFQDDQRRILKKILETVRQEVKASFALLYNHHIQTMEYLRDIKSPIPPYLLDIASFVLNQQIYETLETEEVDCATLIRLLDEIRKKPFRFEQETFEFLVIQKTNQLFESWKAEPKNLSRIEKCADFLGVILPTLNIMRIWRAQNQFIRLSEEIAREMSKAAQTGDQSALTWINAFNRLGILLNVEIRI